MPTNEYGQPTDSKGNVKTQSELIEAELEPMITTFTGYIQRNVGRPIGECFDDFKKDLAALVLKHRHDVYFQAYRDGLQQGRKEGDAILESAKQREVDLTIQNLINYELFTPEELDKAVKKMKHDTPASS